MFFCPSTLPIADLVDAVLGWLYIHELIHHMQVLLLLAGLITPPLPLHHDVQQGPSLSGGESCEVCWKCLATTSSDFFEFVLNRGGKSLPTYLNATCNLFFWVLHRNSGQVAQIFIFSLLITCIPKYLLQILPSASPVGWISRAERKKYSLEESLLLRNWRSTSSLKQW